MTPKQIELMWEREMEFNRENNLMFEIDRIPRYAPSHVMIAGFGMVPVSSTVFYPKGTHPKDCPLIQDIGALELKTNYGSRWWGFEDGYINSQLRMVVVGFPKSCELRSKWTKVPVKFRR